MRPGLTGRDMSARRALRGHGARLKWASLVRRPGVEPGSCA
jgi:hypothetical protein